MTTHSLDDLVLAVRAAAGAAQRMLVTREAVGRHRLTRMRQAAAEQDLLPENLVPAPRTRICRLHLTIPVTVTDAANPTHPRQRILALVPATPTTPQTAIHWLSIDIKGTSLQEGGVTFDDITLDRFAPPAFGDMDHDQA